MATKIKLETSTPFRAISKIFVIILFYVEISHKAPSRTTILNWIHKIGYFQLTSPKEIANDWIVIFDETIQFGRDKALIIFGIREKDYDFTRPLRLNDLKIFRIEVKTNWNGESVRDVLIELERELGHIIYAVSDNGSDLKKGLREAGICQIHDITHRLALIFEKIFSAEETFEEITTKMVEMREANIQTQWAYCVPVQQRKKSRYLNIEAISEWLVKTIRKLEKKSKMDTEVRKKLEWVLKYKEYAMELSKLSQTVSQVEKIIKTNGLSKITATECEKITKKLKGEKGQILNREIREYFSEMMARLPEKKKILATSDIIESAFGKYKNYVSNNPMAGITNLILCIAAFTAPMTQNNIKMSMEQVRMEDIQKWSKKTVGETLYKKRKNLYKGCKI